MSRADPITPAPAASPMLVAIGGITALCMMDAAMKQVVASVHPLTATFGRSLLGLFFAAPLWMLAGRPPITRDVLRAHAIRGAVMTFSATSFFWALTVLPLAEAVTLSFIAPLIIPFVAWALLKEKPRLSNLVACLIGFAGVLVTTQGAPAASDTPQRTFGILLMMVAAVAWAGSLVLLRGRASRDGPAIVILMGSFVPALLLSPFALAIGQMPGPGPLAWLLGAAALACAGIWMMTRAYARAEAQVLAPLEYTALAWAALFGWLLFGELPRLQVWLGATIIIGACLYVAWAERRVPPATVG